MVANEHESDTIFAMATVMGTSRSFSTTTVCVLMLWPSCISSHLQLSISSQPVEKNDKTDLSLNMCYTIVVHFNQCLGAAHSKLWSKYAFSKLFVLKS